MLCISCHLWKYSEDFRSKLKNKPQNSNCRRCLDIKEGNKITYVERNHPAHQRKDLQPKKIMTPEQHKLVKDLNKKIKEIKPSM